MTWRGSVFHFASWVLLAACVLVSFTCALASPTRACTIDEYRAHLGQFKELLRACKSKRTADNCSASSVGPDDLVQLRSRQRLVDYEWIRYALGNAGTLPDKDATAQERTDQQQHSVLLLDEALQRLETDDAQAVGVNKASTDPMQATMAHAQPALHAVLSSTEFHDIAQPSLWDRAMQKLMTWLNGRLNVLSSAHGPSRNLVRALVYSSILICLTLLVWWYARQVRRQRLALTASPRVHASAASAVDWQLRVQQAQELAARGDWRQAVHLIYWAAISRLEALGNWPADRARTPREYLGLLPQAHRKRADLARLTRGFERTWYGNETAQQSDFDDARSLLERLGPE